MYRSRMLRTFVSASFLVCVGLLALGSLPAHAQDKKFKVYLSMSVTGRGWLTAASNSIEALATQRREAP